MAIDITMPALSPTMTEGTLARWIKKEGDDVRSGDVLAEIETDKATMEVEAVDEGKLGNILVADGTEGVKVGTVIAVLLDEGETAAPLTKSNDAVTPLVKGPAEEETAKPRPAPEEAPRAAAKTHSASAANPPLAGNRIFVSPLARRLAKESAVDLSSISGTGPHGRIIKSDIEKAIAGGVTKAQPAAPAVSPTPMVAPQNKQTKEQVQVLAGGIGFDLKPHSNMRRAIARRLAESKRTIPHFYLTVECEIDALLNARTELNKFDAANKISVNDFVIHAAALALRKVPAANASWSDDGTLLWQSVDIAVAVALDEGLITPIVKNADQKGLGAISREIKDLAQRAKAGKLKPEEFQGGTFSISNLGMYGIKEFSAVINPPHGCILAVGAGEERAVVKNGSLAVATMMSCTLSVDHRVVDGSVGAEYLRAFKGFIETPVSMLL